MPVRVEDLHLRELLELEPEGGPLRFAGQRALIIDAVAMGLLRRALVEAVGLELARCVLTRFGYAHGWRTAELMRDAFPWDDERAWQTAGSRLHMLQGLVIVEPHPRTPDEGPEPFAECVWRASFEAEQHRLHLGAADAPVCWTLCGFASGYLSRVNGRAVICVEQSCAGQGADRCHMVGRFVEDWGEDAEAHRAPYATRTVDAALRRATDELKQTERALTRRRRALARAEAAAPAPPSPDARSAAMREVLALARSVAPVDSTVLITGESGVGKERLARRIHAWSRRADGPFVAVNCGAIAESLLESELFGHVRGAFTGAAGDRVGVLEAAEGGTLLLDEIGEVRPAVQVRLLRALQEREIRRVGDSRSRPIDVRVVAATNRDLARDVDTGRFRKDLYYRLRVIEVRVPPLRERREDVLPLARELVQRTAARIGCPPRELSPEAADRLLAYPWPGNVRELENALEHALVVARGRRLRVGDLPAELRDPAASLPLSQGVLPLADVERAYILRVLEANDGHRAKTAEQLGIGVATLYRRLRSYGGGEGTGRS
jgi:DNA-binding NtrC family response regulator